MNQGWQKIFDLMKRTQERCFVLDNESQEVYAILKLADYEKLIDRKEEVVDLTEDELLDRINCDIAMWQANQNEDEGEDGDEGNGGAKKENKEEEFYLEPVETSS